MKEAYGDSYDPKKFHGGLMVGAKCQFEWEHGELCFHQVAELMLDGMNRQIIMKRDFEQIEVK